MSWATTLTDAVAELRGPDPDSPELRATLDARDLTVLPAVWIKLVGLVGPKSLAVGGLAPTKAQVHVYAAVATQPTVAATFAALEAHAASVLAKIPAMDNPVHVSLQLPAGGTPVTCLRWGHDLLITEGDPE